HYKHRSKKAKHQQTKDYKSLDRGRYHKEVSNSDHRGQRGSDHRFQPVMLVEILRPWRAGAIVPGNEFPAQIILLKIFIPKSAKDLDLRLQWRAISGRRDETVALIR